MFDKVFSACNIETTAYRRVGAEGGGGWGNADAHLRRVGEGAGEVT